MLGHLILIPCWYGSARGEVRAGFSFANAFQLNCHPALSLSRQRYWGLSSAATERLPLLALLIQLRRLESCAKNHAVEPRLKE
jgi:hypothetical protein